MTCLVRVQAAVNAPVEHIGKGCTKETAGRCRTGERVTKDRCERRTDIAKIRQDHRKCADDINNRHRWHDRRGHCGYPLNATDDHQRKQHR